EPGIRCVAAPVHNHTGQVIASISVAGRTTSVTSNRVPELIRVTRDTAYKISMRLGYREARKISSVRPDRIRAV
ncbi:MAG: hypothetical protein GWO23_25155, partial [Gammaproteobacteria bacterium]|nr:hypothetical protein [Gammaproteobacteria bacterium]NIR25450.1 hypothetical protein [Gammaproteobacteria bacterium]